MNKILWIDLETTGLDPDKHGVIQISALYEEDNEIKDRINLKSGVFEKDIIDERAMEINGIKPMDLIKYPEPKIAMADFLLFLENYVDKGDYKDKIYLAGYNTSFDISFLKNWFQKNSNYDFNKYFHRKFIDVMQVAIFFNYNKIIQTKNNKLKTMCDYFGIELAPHDAMNDILATHSLSKKFKGLIKKRE